MSGGYLSGGYLSGGICPRIIERTQGCLAVFTRVSDKINCLNVFNIW